MFSMTFSTDGVILDFFFSITVWIDLFIFSQCLIFFSSCKRKQNQNHKDKNKTNNNNETPPSPRVISCLNILYFLLLEISLDYSLILHIFVIPYGLLLFFHTQCFHEWKIKLSITLNFVFLISERKLLACFTVLFLLLLLFVIVVVVVFQEVNIF